MRAVKRDTSPLHTGRHRCSHHNCPRIRPGRSASRNTAACSRCFPCRSLRRGIRIRSGNSRSALPRRCHRSHHRSRCLQRIAQADIQPVTCSCRNSPRSHRHHTNCAHRRAHSRCLQTHRLVLLHTGSLRNCHNARQCHPDRFRHRSLAKSCTGFQNRQSRDRRRNRHSNWRGSPPPGRPHHHIRRRCLLRGTLLCQAAEPLPFRHPGSEGRVPALRPVHMRRRSVQEKPAAWRLFAFFVRVTACGLIIEVSGSRIQQSEDFHEVRCRPPDWSTANGVLSCPHVPFAFNNSTSDGPWLWG